MSRGMTLAPVRTLDPDRNPVLSALMRSEDLLDDPKLLATQESLYGVGDASESLHAPDEVVEGQRRVIAGGIESGNYVMETHEGVEIWEDGKRAALYGLLAGQPGQWFFGADPRHPLMRIYAGGRDLYAVDPATSQLYLYAREDSTGTAYLNPDGTVRLHIDPTQSAFRLGVGGGTAPALEIWKQQWLPGSGPTQVTPDLRIRGDGRLEWLGTSAYLYGSTTRVSTPNQRIAGFLEIGDPALPLVPYIRYDAASTNWELMSGGLGTAANPAYVLPPKISVAGAAPTNATVSSVAPTYTALQTLTVTTTETCDLIISAGFRATLTVGAVRAEALRVSVMVDGVATGTYRAYPGSTGQVIAPQVGLTAANLAAGTHTVLLRAAMVTSGDSAAIAAVDMDVQARLS